MNNSIMLTKLLSLGFAILLSCCPFKSHCQIENEDWKIKPPAEFGLDDKLLAELKTQLENGSFGNTHEVIIIKNGYQVFEHYAADHQPDDPVRVAFSKDLTGEPGERFEYNGGMSITLSYLVDKALDSNTIDYAERKLFKPLGIKDYQWRNIRCGLLDFDGGLSLRPRDMAKIGQLMLNKGKWNDKQIISNDWVEASTQMYVNNQGSPDYGYQWWGGQYSFYDNTCSIYMASGHGGQLIVVIPEFEMVVVITQQVFDNPMGQINTIGILAKYILPSAKSSEITQVSPKESDLKKWTGKYSMDEAQLDIIIQDNHLVAIGGDGSQIMLDPIGPNKFVGMAIDILPVYFEFAGNKCNARFAFQNQEYLRVKK